MTGRIGFGSPRVSCGRGQKVRTRVVSLFGVPQNKKADVAEHPEAFHHVGLLVNGSSAVADYPLFSLPITSQRLSIPENSPAGCDRADGVSRQRGQRAGAVRALSPAAWGIAMSQFTRPPDLAETYYGMGLVCSPVGSAVLHIEDSDKRLVSWALVGGESCGGEIFGRRRVNFDCSIHAQKLSRTLARSRAP